MSTVIKVENLWKEYRYGVINHKVLYKDLQSWWSRKMGKDDPNALIGQEGLANELDRFWALRDLNFEIRAGESIGVIGRNGAGKSTLLKILSRVTTPSRGSVKIKGRVASLLEVGTGFHPELTGRENVFLNGTILGLTKLDIRQRFDSIVDFSGVEKFIDTPVKRYSSGMKVRLAFAVAAHLEPEILIVDEVLAVGDAEFQRKGLGKMDDVAKEGRTVIFVSHNMGAVRQLCKRGILLKDGGVEKIGNIENIVNHYLDDSEHMLGESGEMTWEGESSPGSDIGKLTKVIAKNIRGKIVSNFKTSENIQISVFYELLKAFRNVRVILIVETLSREVVFTTTSQSIMPNQSKKGKYRVQCVLPKKFFRNTSYLIKIKINSPGRQFIVPETDCLKINIVGEEYNGSLAGSNRNFKGVIAPSIPWSITSGDKNL